VETSFENDLQLFVTTHSKLAARYFWYHFRKGDFKVDPHARDIKYFLVERNSNTGKVDCTPIDIYYPADESKLESALFGS